MSTKKRGGTANRESDDNAIFSTKVLWKQYIVYELLGNVFICTSRQPFS